ncbi:MAG: 3-deoxy-D-manno-octulosonic acid transferase, partial [Akkermansiaceae bacterium]|nr:3-deoxy-D-manno-octulosonic acid transferase [Akkermansiaceae bacterium]
CAQADEHAETWREIGVRREAIVVTGSVKFDQEGIPPPVTRGEFGVMLNAFGRGRPVVLAASTHPGEEVLVARAAAGVPGVLPVVLPRHAERRREVRRELEQAGFEVVLRSEFREPEDPSRAVLVVDSTGELRDWTAHADLVVIGKSLLARGGQNPVEAIEAGVPVVCGLHMENFEPLISELRTKGGVRTVSSEAGLEDAIAALLGRARERTSMAKRAAAVLTRHRGATARTRELLAELAPGGTTDGEPGPHLEP